MTDGPFQIIDRAAKALEHHQSALHLSDEYIASIKRVDYFRSKTRQERREMERRRADEPAADDQLQRALPEHACEHDTVI